MTAEPAGAEATAGAGKGGDQPPPSRATPRRRPVVVSILGSSWLLGALITATAMPLWIPTPGAGLDSSWQAAMHMAARTGVDYGSGIDFTYGPLGFLAIPILYYPTTGVLAGLFGLAVRLVTVVGVLWSARRSLGLVFGLVAAYLAAHALLYVDPPQIIPVALLLAAVTVLGRDDRDRLDLVALGLGLLTVWFTGRGKWRSEVLLLAPFAVTLLLGWLVTGNSIGDLLTWWSASLQIASGYSTAMALETTRSGDPYLLVLVLAAVGAAVWLGTAGWRAGVRAAAALGVAGTLFVAFKHGFVRHDGHIVSFFGVLPAVVLSFRMSWRWMVPLFATVVIAFVVANPFPNQELIDPEPGIDRATAFAGDITSPARLRRTIAASKEALRTSYALDEATLAALAGHPVHIDPWETAVAWAYPELEWRPLPVFQSYSAYTDGLDGMNADALVAPDGPTRILRQTPRSVDARNADFESPQAVLAMLCNFEEAFVAGEWQVLARAVDRCGEAESLGRVTVGRGEWVDVPAAPAAGGPALVMATLDGVEGPLAGKAVSLLYKAPEAFMEVDDGTTFRLVPETADHPLLMDAPPELGYSAPFGFARQITRFRLFQRHDLGIDRFEEVTVEFLRIPLSPPAGTAGRP